MCIRDSPKSISMYKQEFRQFFNDNSMIDLSSNELDLLNYILFPKEAKDYYVAQDNKPSDDVIGLQEGFGLYID